jgi:biopolymer transport protein ExbB
MLLLTMMLGAALVVLLWPAADSFGQAAPGGGGAAAPAETGSKTGQVVRLILSNLDFIFFIILGLSVLSLTLIIQAFIKNRPSVFLPPATTDQVRDMIAQRRFKDLIEFTETDPSFLSKALNPALKRAPSISRMKEAMETAIGEETAEQFRRIEYLNIIGNLGPLLGLLGTVLGMIEAFQAVATSGGQADVSKLSGGISTALCHTFLGLFLAVPCLAAFGVLRTIVDRLTVRGALLAEEMLMMMMPQEARGAAAGSGLTGSGLAAVRAGAVPQPAVPSPPPARKPAAPIPAP